jgi:uncharacterized membrane protein YeaQ/YmgE (transglycosylase-associated protein family)
MGHVRPGFQDAGAWRRNMGFFSWIILGLIAGFVAGKLVNKTGQGMLIDIGLGIVGAVVGGFIVSILGMGGVSGLNLWSFLVAIGGSVVVILAYRRFYGAGGL